MAELRYHPLIDDWIMIASHRQSRPQMPKDWCPFCPGSGKVPDHYDVLEYDNDFPALSQTPPPMDDVTNDFFQARPAYGKCEVILYSPNHTANLYDLTDDHVKKLVDLWCERFETIAGDPKIQYVFIFENRGDAVGVTMPHPHGQIYGYSWMPKKLELEIKSAKKYHKEHGNCLFCDLLKNELDFQKRIIFQNKYFTVFLPYFSEYPYGVYIFSNDHKQTIAQFTQEERFVLGQTVKQVSGMYDQLFGYRFPYMMCMHNAPVNQKEDLSPAYHFHVEYFPPMRAADKQKFNASSETGAWAHCNPTAPEEKAEELRAAYQRYLESDHA